MSRCVVLLKTFMLSGSRIQRLRIEPDKKKRRRMRGGIIGTAILYLMVAGYAAANAVGYGMLGLGASIPVLCALIISVLSFFFTFMKTNGYLFNSKDHEMLAALPVRPVEVVSCRFLCMYLRSLPWYGTVSFAMMISYGVFERPAFAVYPVWIVLSLILPLIPMVLASFIGFIIAKIGTFFGNKTIVQTVLTMLVVMLAFGSRFFLEDMFREGKTSDVLRMTSDGVERAGSVFLPAGGFGGAVTRLSVPDILLLAGCSILLFIIVFIPVGRYYNEINSALMARSAARGKTGITGKKRSTVNTIAFKEWKRMTSSSTYMANVLIGEVFCIIAGIAVWFVDIEKLLANMLHDAPVTATMLFPAIPFIFYFFVGMVATTAFTPSLEGKNDWIMKSMPVDKKTVTRGKMLFNMYLTVPSLLFAVVSFSLSANVPPVSMILYMILGTALCAFSTAWGSVCGLKHCRLDWENEVEVIKQGAAVTIYLFPNMIACVALAALSVFLGTKINGDAVTAVITCVVILLAWICYKRSMSLAGE